MRNPFIMMALAFSAAQAAFRNAMAQQSNYEPKAAHTRSRVPGKPQPAGSKLARTVKNGRATCRHGKPYHTKQGIAFLAAQERAATR